MTHAGLLAWGVAARSQAAPAREEPPHLLTRRPTRCPRTGTAPSGWRRTRTGRPPFWCTEAGSLASPSRPFLGETGKGSVQAQVPWRKMELGGCPRPGQSCLCLCTHTGTVRTQGSPTRPPGGSEAPRGRTEAARLPAGLPAHRPLEYPQSSQPEASFALFPGIDPITSDGSTSAQAKPHGPDEAARRIHSDVGAAACAGGTWAHSLPPASCSELELDRSRKFPLDREIIFLCVSSFTIKIIQNYTLTIKFKISWR